MQRKTIGLKCHRGVTDERYNLAAEQRKSKGPLMRTLLMIGAFLELDPCRKVHTVKAQIAIAAQAIIIKITVMF